MKPNHPFERSITSNVGRHVDSEGTDEGDALFVTRDLGFTPEVEAAELEKNSRQRADLALTQIELLVREHPALATKAFTDLLALYPDDPRANEWRARI